MFPNILSENNALETYIHNMHMYMYSVLPLLKEIYIQEKGRKIINV